MHGRSATVFERPGPGRVPDAEALVARLADAVRDAVLERAPRDATVQAVALPYTRGEVDLPPDAVVYFGRASLTGASSVQALHPSNWDPAESVWVSLQDEDLRGVCRVVAQELLRGERTWMARELLSSVARRLAAATWPAPFSASLLVYPLDTQLRDAEEDLAAVRPD